MTYTSGRVENNCIYSWEREECHRCRLYACCVGLDECRQKVNGEWEEHCSAFKPKEEEK